MKKLHSKLIGVSALLICALWTLYGCTDVAEHPDGRLNMEEVFTNPTRVAGYLNSCYIGFTNSRGDNYGGYTMLASCTDEAHDVKDVLGGVASLWNNGSASAFSNPLAAPEIWDFYTYIRSCNVFLENIPTARTYSEAERQGYEGQTYAGACPSQELIDSYETIDGQQPILGYSDEDHLHPIINTAATLYKESDPYANRDPRLKASIYYHGVPTVPGGSTLVNTTDSGNCAISQTNVRYTRTGYYLRKFNNCKSDRTMNNDGYFKIFRMAEMYLNYAEAANEAAASIAPNEAVDAVNRIRARVGMPNIPYGLSKEDFRARVRHERRIELAYEEHRFYDVRRWKILSETDKVVTGMKPVKTNGQDSFERFVVNRRKAYTDKYLRFALPKREVIKLKNKTGFDFQNEGW